MARSERKAADHEIIRIKYLVFFRSNRRGRLLQKAVQFGFGVRSLRQNLRFGQPATVEERKALEETNAKEKKRKKASADNGAYKEKRNIQNQKQKEAEKVLCFCTYFDGHIEFGSLGFGARGGRGRSRSRRRHGRG